MLRRIALSATGAALVLAMSTATAFAGTGNPNGTGQPSQDCESQPMEPAGFATAGFAHAKIVYANPGAQGGVSSGNSTVVSQYDVACFHVSQNHA